MTKPIRLFWIHSLLHILMWVDYFRWSLFLDTIVEKIRPVTRSICLYQNVMIRIFPQDIRNTYDFSGVGFQYRFYPFRYSTIFFQNYQNNVYLVNIEFICVMYRSNLDSNLDIVTPECDSKDQIGTTKAEENTAEQLNKGAVVTHWPCWNKYISLRQRTFGSVNQNAKLLWHDFFNVQHGIINHCKIWIIHIMEKVLWGTFLVYTETVHKSFSKTMYNGLFVYFTMREKN